MPNVRHATVGIPVSIQIQFPIGCWVRLNQRGRMMTPAHADRIGEVVGYAARSDSVLVIKWEGDYFKVCRHRSQLERAG